MKKIHKKQKRWLRAKSRTAIRKLQKKNKRKSKGEKYNKYYVGKYDKVTVVDVPTIFSITDNPNDTLSFFNKVYGFIKQFNFKEELFFNLANVEVITVDAIMYLIALLKNTKRIKIRQIRCSGNIPINEEAQRVIETSGFYKYMSPKYDIKYVSSSNIQISSGYEADPVLIGKICDFVHNNSSLSRLDTKSLFSMIMELMTNTKQHAYGDNESIKSKWYIFVENGVEQIQFVFLDTGAGIPNTIRTNFFEKLKKILNNSDAYFISSALRGEFRTETGLGYRGKGLPEIYNRISEKIISDFSIVSCSGKCDVDVDGAISETKLSNDLMGTLFYWKLNKHQEENDI